MKYLHNAPTQGTVVDVLRRVTLRATTATPGSLTVISGGGQSVVLEFMGKGKIRMQAHDRAKDLGELVYTILSKVGVRLEVSSRKDC